MTSSLGSQYDEDPPWTNLVDIIGRRDDHDAGRIVALGVDDEGRLLIGERCDGWYGTALTPRESDLLVDWIEDRLHAARHSRPVEPARHELVRKPVDGGAGHTPGVGWMCTGCEWRFSYDVPEDRALEVWGKDERHADQHATAPCCDLHGPRCEPPSELCCPDCTERDHPRHPPGVTCTWRELTTGPAHGCVEMSYEWHADGPHSIFRCSCGAIEVNVSYPRLRRLMSEHQPRVDGATS